MRNFPKILFSKFRLKGLTLITLILGLIILQQSCNKSGISNSSQPGKAPKKNAVSDTNTVEKPLAEYVQDTKNNLRESNIATSGCGAYFNGSYGGSGFYTYPDKSLDFTSLFNGSSISISVSSYDVPNLFNIYDGNGSLVATSGWMGYATYSGPWGQSLSQTVETKTLTFIKANPGTYTLRVQTSTQSYSDSWNASIVCSSIQGANRICGSEFAQFGLNGSTYAAAVDSFGKWHNDYQIGLLSAMEANNINLNTDSIQSFLHNYTLAFMANKGITPQNTSLPNLDITDTTWINPSYSSSAQAILTQLKSLINNYSLANHSAFISQCDSLESNALNLTVDSEAIRVGMVASITINSFNYWKDNASTWANYLDDNAGDTIVVLRVLKTCPVNLRHLGGADATGALTGARTGVGSGPEGAVAGAILGAAVYSSGNILGQALNCMPGVVGRVSQWISSWF